MKKLFFSALVAVLLLSTGCRRPKLQEWELDITRPPEKWLEVESVRLLSDYVRIDTRRERGELEGAEFLKQLFDCAGIESEIVCPAPRRCNLLARIPGRRRDGALLLLNHIDVAPADLKTWREAGPFDGRIKRGYLYGRGAYDMKSLALAQALAMRSLKEHGIVPESDVRFLAEADEESGHRWGARWILENRPEFFEGVSAIINEGATIEVILRDPRFWGIETLQAGYATAEFESTKKAALDVLAERWRKLDSTVVEPHPHVLLAFDLLANHLPNPLTDPLRHLDRVRNDPKELALLPDRYASFLQRRIYWSGTLPDPEKPNGFMALTVISTPPGMDPTTELDRVLEDAKKSGITITHRFSGGPTSASPYPTAFTELLRRVTESHYPGVPFGPIPAFSAYTTSVFLREKGFPTYGYSSIPLNITDTARRHGLDERIYLRDYIRGVDLFRDVLEEFALNPPGPGLSAEPLAK